jgi:hypothetical protein
VLACGASANGQSITLPGTIQVEDFDQGGAEVAYHDTSAANEGGDYRGTGVDIEASTEGGFNVGWTAPGEWLRYTVNVAQTGTYTLEFRVAAPFSGGRFHVEINGVDRTGPITVPLTGGWQTWQTVTRTGVSLNAGSQVWRLVLDSSPDGGDVANFNYIRVSSSGGSGGGGGGGGTPPPGGSSTPYTGTPTALPGTLQLENFDNGAEGVAYHDGSVGNEGGTYRSSGVDVEQTTDAGGGYNLGWAYEGEWLAYTVNVASAGTYTLEVRVASLDPGGSFHIETNGVDRTGPITVPDTGGWQNWVTIRRTGITLPAGQQSLRLVLDADGDSGAVGNFNYLRVTSGGSAPATSPFNGSPAVLPGTVQFENFDNGADGAAYHDLSSENSGGQHRSTGVDIEATSDSGGGFSVGWAFEGEWLAYTVNVASAGTYDIEARVASAGSGGTFHIEVNGVDRTGPFTVPNTGSWQSWVTLRKTGLSLNAGQQVWRVVLDSDGSSGAVGNFNYFRVVAASGSSNQAPSVNITSPANGSSRTAPADITMTASASDSDGTVSRVDFYVGGTLVGSDTSSPYDYTWQDAPAGNYSLTAVARDDDGATTTSAAVSVSVSSVTSTPTTVVFSPSPDHALLVSSYSVAIYRSGTSPSGTPSASRSLGKPSPVGGEVSVSITDIVNPLPAGSYYAVVTAVGSGGSTASDPSPAFTK